MSISANDLLHHILEECHYLEMLIEDGLTKEELFNDQTLQRAVSRSLGIIDEATKNVGKNFREHHREIE